ncbi:hypothetical protein TWF694_002602 [Orbilia ellipsospora]|uniref:DUF6594 domain-containing protein n=1 Tax=Orbilia ellipsospora TaxID=2528407 RepID=A0AAV9X2I6_9PEZI
MVDDLIDRNFRIRRFESARAQDIRSLQNWENANACIAREETEFLSQRDDLLCLSAPKDGFLSWLERSVSERLLAFIKKSRSNISRDEDVYIYSQSATNIVARALLTPLIVIILLAPVITCNFISNVNARLAVVVSATGVFLTVLSLLTKGKMLDLVVAGATYTTVLIVFISGPGSNPPVITNT